MSFPWACRLPVDAAPALAALRLQTGIRQGLEGKSLWLRGDRLDDALRDQLLRLPAGVLYEHLPDGQLRADDQLVPVTRLPVLDWKPLSEMLAIELPTGGLAGELPSRVPLTLVRAERYQPPDVLLIPFDEFARWGESAPAVRMSKLRFAVRADNLALVQGEPLPPLPGRLFVSQSGIAVPAGWTWDPPVDAAALVAMWNLVEGELLLWESAETIQRIAMDEFVRCTRSSLFATRNALLESH